MGNNVEVLRRIELTCYACSREQAVLVHGTKWERYMRGELVQIVWPNTSASFREQMIGARTNMWMCEDCWETEFGSDD